MSSIPVDRSSLEKLTRSTRRRRKEPERKAHGSGADDPIIQRDCVRLVRRKSNEGRVGVQEWLVGEHVRSRIRALDRVVSHAHLLANFIVMPG